MEKKEHKLNENKQKKTEFGNVNPIWCKKKHFHANVFLLL